MAPMLAEREGQRQVMGLQAHLNTAYHQWLGFGRLILVVSFTCSSPDDTALIQSRSRTSVQALNTISAGLLEAGCTARCTACMRGQAHQPCLLCLL